MDPATPLVNSGQPHLNKQYAITIRLHRSLSLSLVLQYPDDGAALERLMRTVSAC